ncbi:DUF3108 domain-containing protein [Limimaricola pyoseonensis]|uniref:DUF3108 domain-containing protein n=1 Tax=Limimaricola pyoseonensis TaxID=521013 RepID=A0A1G7J2P9_9RHOB|nr:Protein of unknown function [Limimaricola pyoseonensis]
MSTRPSRLGRLAGLCLLAAWPGLAAAESFTVSLAGDRLGQVSYAREGGGARLVSTFDSTPFGVFDGRFAAQSQAEGGVVAHSAATRSSRKTRDVSMKIDGGRVATVSVQPAEEATALSVAAAVPAGVLDPVTAFGRLVDTRGCPDAIRVFDGRRVAELSLETAERQGERAFCQLRHKVVAGPGYLAPLELKSLSLRLDYAAPEGGVWRLEEISARAGIFTVTLAR